MFMVDLLGWWYTQGWLWSAKHFFIKRNRHVLTFFSAGTLLKTLFAPYRQTFAGRRKGAIGNRIRGAVDSLISRMVGFLVRIFLLIGTLCGVLFNTVLALCIIALWPLLPLAPLLGVVFMLAGVGI